MPKLKYYQIKHIINATKCDDARARKVFGQLFPELDKKGKVRKMTQDQYKQACRAVTDPDYLIKLKSKNTKVEDTTPAPEVKKKEIPPSPQIQPPPTHPSHTQGQAKVSLSFSNANINNTSDQTMQREYEILFEMIVEEKHKCDTILKPLVGELDAELNDGKNLGRETRGGVWSHIYTVMHNRHMINIRAIIDNQTKCKSLPEPSSVKILVHNRLVDLAISIGRNWLVDIRRRKETDHLAKKSHNPSNEPTMKLGDIITKKP